MINVHNYWIIIKVLLSNNFNKKTLFSIFNLICQFPSSEIMELKEKDNKMEKFRWIFRVILKGYEIRLPKDSNGSNGFGKDHIK